MREIIIAGLLFGSGIVFGMYLGKKILWNTLTRDYIVLYKGCFSNTKIKSVIKRHKERKSGSKNN